MMQVNFGACIRSGGLLKWAAKINFTDTVGQLRLSVVLSAMWVI